MFPSPFGTPLVNRTVPNNEIVVLRSRLFEVLKAILEGQPHPLYIFGIGIQRLKRTVLMSSLTLLSFHICQHT
jgi:hypothetical protein